MHAHEHHQNAVGCFELDRMDAITVVHTKIAADKCHVASEALVAMSQPYEDINYLPILFIAILLRKSLPATIEIRFFAILLK